MTPDGQKPRKSLDALISSLQADGILKTPSIIDAFRVVDRAAFVPEAIRDQAYQDIPLPIGWGQTISQPYTVAVMLEALQPKQREHVLDVGTGSGWVAALLAQLVGPRGSVIGIELLPQLIDRATAAITPWHFTHLQIVPGDASRGWPQGAPYDIIHVAAATAVIPSELKEQLAPGGRLIIPVGETIQDLALVTKTGDNGYTETRLSGFQFVPLIATFT